MIKCIDTHACRLVITSRKYHVRIFVDRKLLILCKTTLIRKQYFTYCDKPCFPKQYSTSTTKDEMLPM